LSEIESLLLENENGLFTLICLVQWFHESLQVLSLTEGKSVFPLFDM
jgi:hypothetical protein